MGCGSSSSPTPTTNGTAIGESASGSKSSKKGKSADATVREGTSKMAEYATLNLLGDGMSCQVIKVQHRVSKIKFALKKMNKPSKPKAYDDNKAMFQAEVALLRKIIHPHILEIVDAWETPKEYCILTKLCEGGELFDRISECAPFTEKIASLVTRHMLEALAFCHERNIVHRDIKPENFVYETNEPNSPIRLIDFGCALQVSDSTMVTHFAGSPYYMAPEVVRGMTSGNPAHHLNGATWKKADVWSIGVIVYILMTGRPPFNVTPETMRKIFDGFEFPSDAPMSASVKNFITICLLPDSTKRLSAKQCLQHAWVKGDTASDVALPPTLTNALQSFTAQNKLRKAVGKALACRMAQPDKEALHKIFKQFDVNGDGVLSPEEIVAMMKSVGIGEQEAKHMAKELDDDGSGGIDINEMAHVHALAQTKANDKQLFKMFDKDGDGQVTAAEILEVCNFLTSDQVSEIMTQADSDKNGKLNFDEWIKAMGAVRK